MLPAKHELAQVHRQLASESCAVGLLLLLTQLNMHLEFTLVHSLRLKGLIVLVINAGEYSSGSRVCHQWCGDD